MSGPPRLPGSRRNDALAPEVIGPMLHDFPAVVEEIRPSCWELKSTSVPGSLESV